MKMLDVVKPSHGELPGWARRCPEVVQLCQVNMEFRRNVLTATHPVYKRVLIQKARSVVREVM